MDERPLHPYENLTPDTILDAVESLGFHCDGHILALNSYENRVYQIGIEDRKPLVGKFYRPERWSDEAILEEHEFALELAAHEIPVVAPLECDGRTLHDHGGFRFALFPRRGGRWPELESPDNREWVGRFLGRIHAVGAVRPFARRPTLVSAEPAMEASRTLLAEGWIPDHLLDAYSSLVRDLEERLNAAFARCPVAQPIRLHGDCHPGNILWTPDGPHFVDLDDCLNGPAVQDLWMLLSGDRGEMTVQLSDIVAGYEDFHDFDHRELGLIEPLRTMRIMRYAAWIATRWGDPAFPAAFPWFNEVRYWENHILSLREQAALMDEPPLMV